MIEITKPTDKMYLGSYIDEKYIDAIKDHFLLESHCGILGMELEKITYALNKDDVILKYADRSIDGLLFEITIPKHSWRGSRVYSKETIDAVCDPDNFGKGFKERLLLQGLKRISDDIDAAMIRLGQLEELKERVEKMLSEIKLEGI